jgi:hypothetical protein
MQERRAKDIERWANILQRLETAEQKIAELSGRTNGKTDEEIIGILYKEVGKGTVSFLAKLFLSVCGVAGAAILAYLGFKGVSAK